MNSFYGGRRGPGTNIVCTALSKESIDKSKVHYGDYVLINNASDMTHHGDLYRLDTDKDDFTFVGNIAGPLSANLSPKYYLYDSTKTAQSDIIKAIQDYFSASGTPLVGDIVAWGKGDTKKDYYAYVKDGSKNSWVYLGSINCYVSFAKEGAEFTNYDVIPNGIKFLYRDIKE